MYEIEWVTLEEATESFNELLDETYPKWEFGGATYYPAQILKEVDPVHYKIALDDYVTFMAENMDQFIKGETDPEDYK